MLYYVCNKKISHFVRLTNNFGGQTMKKFFELSVTSRKSVKATTLISAEALSSSGEKIGQLDIRVLNSDTHGGIFVKYSPADVAVDTLISSIKLTGRDEKEIQEILEMIDAALIETLKSNLGSAMQFIPYYAMMCACIQADTNTIVLPSSLPITNDLIVKLLDGEWLGIEVKFCSEIVEKISDAAEKERKKTADKIEQLLKDLEQLK